MNNSLKCYESLTQHESSGPADYTRQNVHNDVVFVTGRTCPDGFERDQVS